MYCYVCGAALDGSDNCPSCHEDVRMIKKIQAASNLCYNEGLAKAQVRDLSGAAEALKKSLKYNKLNREARNLLGLVYYEMGESVEALSEWVISKSLIPDDNPAGAYLAEVQNSASKIEALNQANKKFNLALQYAKEGNDDLAVIQLKKVLSSNPKLVKGHQLLALLYMKQERYDLAKKALKNAGRVDSNNTQTLTYLKECNRHLRANGKSKREKEPDGDEIISYESGNDLIIRPRRFCDNTAFISAATLLIGIAIGVAVVWFLVVPTVRQQAQKDANSQIVEANESVSTKDQDIETLEEEIEDLNTQIEELQAQITEAENDTTLDSYESLLQAYIAYAGDDYDTATEYLESVEKSDLSDDAKKVYKTILNTVQEEVLGELYVDGVQAYSSGNYEEAVEILTEIVETDETYEDGMAMYYLAHTYYKQKDGTNALIWFQACVDSDVMSSSYQNSSQDYIDYINEHKEDYGVE